MNRRRIFVFSVVIAAALVGVGAFTYATRDPAEALYRNAVELMRVGKSAEAAPLLALIVRDHAQSPYAKDASLLLGHPDAVEASPAEKLFNQARNFYPLGSTSRYDLEQAAIRYLAVADSYPADPVAPAALYEAANCLDALGDHQGAVEIWRRFVADYPSDGRTPEAMYALAYIHYTQFGERELGKTMFLELVGRFPDTSSAEEARKMLGMKKAAPEEEIMPVEEEEPSAPPSVHTEGGGV